MTEKSKTTKQIRAIERIIKFQVDDGIESLSIAGKEVLADVAIDKQGNVTLYLNADGDKINEIQSLVPFVRLATVAGGTDVDKTKTVTLSQDLTQFALEIDSNSNELATLIKSESSIVLDLHGLVQRLLEIAGQLAELEAKNLAQDNRLTAVETKNIEQDNLIAIAQQTAGEHVYYLKNNESLSHRVTIHKYPSNEYDVTFEGVYEGVGITFNVGNNVKTTKGVLLNTIITENFVNGHQIVRSTGATVATSHENMNNFIRFTFTNVTSPVVTLRLKMTGNSTVL